jgi:hypothetical protein
MRIEMIYNQVQVINENIKGSGSRILKVFFFLQTIRMYTFKSGNKYWNNSVGKQKFQLSLQWESNAYP